MSRGMLVALLVTLAAGMAIYAYLQDRYLPPGTGGGIKPVEIAAEMKCAANQRALEAAIAAYQFAYDGVTPSSLEELVPRFVPALVSCPMGGSYGYDRSTGTVSCPNGHPKGS